MFTTKLHDDRGATAVLMAFCLVGLLAFGGLVLDGGNAFAQRRQMQNAADASALAGANELYREKDNTSTRSVYDAALAAAVANGANPASFTCELVRYPSGTASCTGTPPDDAWTVRVNIEQTSKTTLMRVVKIDSFSAKADAEASLLTATPTELYSPFMICSPPVPTGASTSQHLLETTPGGQVVINEDAIGTEFLIWDNNAVDNSCTSFTGFKGLADNEVENDLPGNWEVEPGTSAGNKALGSGVALETLANSGCSMDAATKYKDIYLFNPPCQFAIPLCPGEGVDTNDKKVFYCTLVGRFEIRSGDVNGLTAEFLGGGILKEGEAGGIPTSDAELLIIKLTD